MTERRPIPSPHEDLLLEAAGPLAWLIFNRPRRRNTLRLSAWRAIPEAMAALSGRRQTRVIILRGAGAEAFGAGADIAELASLRPGRPVAEYERANLEAFRAIAEAPVPTIAMIEGYCLGGGLVCALCCDIRLAAQNAVFALTPARVGLAYPEYGVMRLLEAVTAATAREMLLAARRHDAAWALARGLVNAVHPVEKLEEETLALAADIAANAPLTVAHAKAAVSALAETADPGAVRARLRAMADACYASRDFAEGCRAFLEKRKPDFRGE